MKKIALLLLGFWLSTAGTSVIAAAQDKDDGSLAPPKVLVIFREFLKPGKAGSVHEKSERLFPQAFAKAKWPTRYLSVDSLSGRPRTLFLIGYDSFDAWEKDNQGIQKNATLSAALEHATAADADALSETDASVLMYREDQSMRADVSLGGMRYFEISLFTVKPGHRNQWDEIVKLVKEAYQKIPDARWATFELAYGQQGGGTYAVFSPLKSAAEIDKAFAQGKDFVAAMGEDGMKKLSELEAAAIASSQTNLFQFNPALSYPPDRWVKEDPGFWTPKAAPMATPKKAEKPQ